MRKFTKIIPVAAMAAIAFTSQAAPVRKTVLDDSDLYAGSSVSNVARASQKETWKDIGQGWLRDDMFVLYYLMDKYYEIPVNVQESEQTPGRYRLVNAYENYPFKEVAYEKEAYMIIDASDPVHVYMEKGLCGIYIGYDDEKDVYQEMSVWSQADDYYNNKYNNWEKADAENLCGKLKDNVITFPKGAILVNVYEQKVDEDGEIEYPEVFYRPANLSGKFRLLLPGAPRVDIDMSVIGLTEDGEGLRVQTEMQDGVKSAKFAMFPGEYDESMDAGIIDGTVESVESDASGEVVLPFQGDGDYTIVAVPYVEDGTPRYGSWLTRTLSLSEAEWKKIGTALYDEAIMSSNDLTRLGEFVYPHCQYNLEVEQNRENPRLFRLVNPYGPAYPYCYESNYDKTRNYYMEIDCTDREMVMVNLMNDGVGLNLGAGKMRIWSRAARMLQEQGKTVDEVREEGVFGRLDGDVITMPANSILLEFRGNPNVWYWAAKDGTFKVQLPEGAGVTAVGAPAEGGEEWYTLDGLKVSPENAGNGIYIVRNGSKVEKRIIRK